MKKILMMLILSGSVSALAADGAASGTSTGATTTGAMSGSGTSSTNAATGTGTGSNAGANTASTNTASGAGANDSPKAACKSMVESAKNKNFEAFMNMTTDMSKKEKANPKVVKKNFNQMESKYMERLQDLSCGNETVAQDHAVVESESKGEKRLVPFVKTDNGWKFDMKAYQAFYHTEEGHQAKK